MVFKQELSVFGVLMLKCEFTSNPWFLGFDGPASQAMTPKTILYYVAPLCLMAVSQKESRVFRRSDMMSEKANTFHKPGF